MSTENGGLMGSINHNTMRGDDVPCNKEEREYYDLVERTFSILAPYYDIIASPIWFVRDKVVDAAVCENKGVKVLDLATGTGGQAFAFAKRGYQVVAVDLSHAMLRSAARKNKYGEVKFGRADVTRLPFRDRSFDITSVSFALHDMPLTILRMVVREIVRVTKPDGAVMIADYALPRNRFSRSIIFNLVKLYEGDYYCRFVESDLESLLKEAGIKIEGEEPVLFGAAKIIKGSVQGSPQTLEN